MVTQESLQMALQNAQAAGRTQDVNALTRALEQMQANDPNAKDNSLLTGIQNSAYRIAGGVADFLPTVNKAITGYENPRLLIDKGDDGFQLKDILTARMVDEKDLPANASNPFGFTGREFEDAADFIYKKQAELNYQPKVPWDQVKADPSAANVLGFMGETAVTSLPDMAAALISVPAYFASYVAPIAQQRAENDGGRAVTPEDLGYAAVAAIGISQAERFGAKGIFGPVAGNVATRTVGAGIREGTTEAIQEPLQYAAETVGTQTGFDPLEAGDRAAAGFVGGSGAGTGLRATTEVLTGGANKAPEDQEAATALARRMYTIAQANNFNPKNVSNKSSTGGARALLDNVHDELSDEIQDKYDDLGSAIKKDRNDNAEVRKLKRLAKTALKQAKNKVKSTVGTRELQAVQSLVGDTREGQELIGLMRESNVRTDLHNQNLKSGVSRFTDMANPISSGSGYNARSLIEVPARMAITGSLAAATSGASIPIQAGIFAGGRAIDAVTGKRSAVNNFMKANADASSGLPASSGQSVFDRIDNSPVDARTKRLNNVMFDQDMPIVVSSNTQKQSPQEVIAEITGVTSRKQLYEIAGEMRRNPRYQDIKEELDAVQTSMRNGGQIPNIKAVGTMIADHLGVAASADTRVAEMARTSDVLRSARIQQGLEDNRRKIDNLRRDADGDDELNAFDKDVVSRSLDALELDLGRNPVEAAERIIADARSLARDGQRVISYLRPYLERIRQQQKSRKTKE